MTEAKVLELEDGWHVVTHGCHQVSVDADGVIWLAHHFSPEDVDDFVGAVLAAAELGAAKVGADRPADVPAVRPVDGPAALPRAAGGFTSEALRAARARVEARRAQA
jgi:hypothetical protein